jgi:lysine-specific demethylase 8
MPEATIERVERPSYDAFRRRFLSPGRPALITGAMDAWPAMRTWSFAHVAKVLEGRKIAPVVLQGGNFHIDLHDGVRVEEMDFATYQRRIEGTDAPPYYLRLPLEGEHERLFADFEEPVYCRRRIFLKKNLWVGGKGASSDLHYDMTHNVVAQIQGRRRVLLFGPEQTADLHPFPLRTLNWHHSQVHVEAPDHGRFPRYQRAQPIDFEIGPGEMLFIPKGWWHRFETLSPAIAVNFFWLTLGLAPALAVARLAWVASGVRT